VHFNEMYAKLTTLKEIRDRMEPVFEKALEDTEIYNELCLVDGRICDKIVSLLKEPVSYAES